jgi:UDP-2-acetamido-2-deoxy-ribo-hexuluronate aminotransferase
MDPGVMQFIDLKAQFRALEGQIRSRIDRVLEHGQYIMGPEVRELESALEAFTGARHCITVASGTEAIVIALMALDLRPGDEVITTPFTFAATAEAIALLGGKPVFVDVEPRTCNLDPSLLASKFTPRTRAVMPVSLYGQPADMDSINSIAAAHGATVIEDAAQSFGATYRGRRSCNLSKIGVTSFFPSKPLGCYGDGGAIFTSDEGLAQAMRQIRVHGQERRYWHTRIGVGGRMDSIQCAIVLAKLERLEWELARRQEVASRYRELLGQEFSWAGLEHLDERPCQLLPIPASDRSSVYAQFTMICRERFAVQESLQARGVPTAVHYPVPLNRQPAFAQYCCADCTPVADLLAASVLSIPFGPDLSERDQDLVCEALKELAGSGRRGRGG